MSQHPTEIHPAKKRFGLRIWWLILPVVLLLLCGGAATILIVKKDAEGRSIESTRKAMDKMTGGYSNSDGEKSSNPLENLFFGWPSPTAKYITAMPVDLSQIQEMSKYRSCAGHIRDGYDFDQILEADSSMKHYLFPVPAFQGTMDAVKLFAPFDGTVIFIYWEKDKIGGRPHNGNGILLSTPVDPNVQFGFGHLYFARDFQVGDSVKAGELIGYAALYDAGNDFDIDLTAIKKTDDDREVLGSFMDHLSESVQAQFAAVGLTPENTKFSREYREAHPCLYAGSEQNQSPLSHGRGDENWTRLNTAPPVVETEKQPEKKPTETAKIAPTEITLTYGIVLTPYVLESDISSVNEAYSLRDKNPFWGFVHPGVDFMTEKKLVPVQAAVSGVIGNLAVEKADGQMGWHAGFCINYGRDAVCYNLETFSSADDIGTLQKENLFIQVGSFVKAGDVIANLVHGGGGSHIDFGIGSQGQRLCPEPYFTQEARESVLRLIHKDHPDWPMCDPG